MTPDELAAELSAMTDAMLLRHADWLTRCARLVDPREICNLVRVCHRGTGDEEVTLRGTLVGEWRVRRVGYRIDITANASAPAIGGG